MPSACCGYPTRRRRPEKPPALPPNPPVRNGRRLLYLGVGTDMLRGSVSGLVYHVSDHQRRVTVDVSDVPGLLRRRNVILAP